MIMAAMINENRQRRPSWLKVRLPAGEKFFRLKALTQHLHLHTVCEGAHCPNIGECWGAGTATFMILGDICTRNCGFCAVKPGSPMGCDMAEPRRVAEALSKLELRYAVITSVSRDDLPDGGAFIFAETIRQARDLCPQIRLEVLVPDFKGRLEDLRTVIEAGPDVLGHNVETVPSLYARVRPGSEYIRSLQQLAHAKSLGIQVFTKSGLMLGLGERKDEVLEVLSDLRNASVDIVTLGQYLQPTTNHLPVQRFYEPAEFDEYREIASSMGFRHVYSGPLVRSSYHAEEQKRAMDAAD